MLLRRAGKVVCLTLLMLLLFPGTAGIAVALTGGETGNDADGTTGNAVVVVIDRITLDDLLNADIPNIKKLAGAGAIGLMTTNPAAGAPRLPENTYTTIGAGSKVKGGDLSGHAYNAWEPYENGTAGEAYFRHTGDRPAPEAVIHLGIVEIIKANGNLKYNFTIGALGEALHRLGIKTAVIGNADIYKEINRHAVNIAMDSMGLVDYGDVSGSTMKNAPDRITGRKPDYRRWLGIYQELREKAGLIVFETGETSRLDKMTDISLDKKVRQEKKEILHELDGFIGKLAGQMNLNRDLLMVVVPEPTFAAMEKQNFLTPIIVAGKGIGPGLLWSGTVKRNGVVGNTDIAPTIAGFFNSKANRQEGVLYNGQAMSSRPARADFSVLAELNDRILSTFSLRYPLVKGFINTVLVVFIAAIAGLYLRQKFVSYLKPVLLGLTAVPLALLLQSLVLPRPGIITGIAAALALTLLITTAGYMAGRKNELGPFVIIALLTSAVIITDLFIGAPLNKTSPLSYDPITGARFYGLGNEYMGVFIGALIAGSTGAASVFKAGKLITRVVITGIFVVSTYVIIAPQFGTNVGGGIAAVAGFGATLLILYGYSINRYTVTMLAAGVIVVLGGFIVYDMNRNIEIQSHIGRTISLLRETGPGELVNIINRKAAMNWKLITRTTWSWAFMAGLFGFVLFNILRPACGHKIKNDHPFFQNGMVGIITGAVAALLFNDSGVVAAATMMVFGAAPYLTLIINNREEV